MHTLIVGMTESGKSTLAKIMAKQLREQGGQVVILDPIGDPDWKPSVQSVQEFDKILREGRAYFAFIDESGEIFNNGSDLTYSWFATRSRHYGHSVTFIAQRATQIPKTMRDQCNRLYLFTSSAGDGKIHSEEWNKPELEQCNTLPQMEFYCCDRYSKIQRYRITNYKDIEKVVEQTPQTEPKRRKKA